MICVPILIFRTISNSNTAPEFPTLNFDFLFYISKLIYPKNKLTRLPAQIYSTILFPILVDRNFILIVTQWKEALETFSILLTATVVLPYPWWRPFQTLIHVIGFSL